MNCISTGRRGGEASTHPRPLDPLPIPRQHYVRPEKMIQHQERYRIIRYQHRVDSPLGWRLVRQGSITLIPIEVAGGEGRVDEIEEISGGDDVR